jgi:hypothetical protein
MAQFEHISKKNDLALPILPDDLIIIIIQLVTIYPSVLKNLICSSRHFRELVYANIKMLYPYSVSDLVDKVIVNLIRHDSLKMLKLFLTNNFPSLDCTFVTFAENKRKDTRSRFDNPRGLLAIAAYYEKLSILKFLLNDVRCQSIYEAIKEAAKTGNVKIFKLLYSKMSTPQKSYSFSNFYVLGAALSSGSITILNILLNDQQFVLDETSSNLEVLEIMRICKSVECLGALIKSGRFNNNKLIKCSFYKSSLDIKKHLDLITSVSDIHCIKICDHVFGSIQLKIIEQYAERVSKTVNECVYEFISHKFEKYANALKDEEKFTKFKSKIEFYNLNFVLFEQIYFDPSYDNFKLLKKILSDVNYTKIFFRYLHSTFCVMEKLCKKPDKQSLEFVIRLDELYREHSTTILSSSYVEFAKKKLREIQ